MFVNYLPISIIVHNTPPLALLLLASSFLVTSTHACHFALFSIVCKKSILSLQNCNPKIPHVVISPIWCIVHECELNKFVISSFIVSPLALSATLNTQIKI